MTEFSETVCIAAIKVLDYEMRVFVHTQNHSICHHDKNCMSRTLEQMSSYIAPGAQNAGDSETRILL